MFNPSLDDVRNFFFETFRKGNQGEPLTPLEKIAFSVVLEHPEYNIVLANPDKYRDFKWLPEAGETNPFLHLSMHLTIIEQLSINQPVGIQELYKQLSLVHDEEHQVQHQIMDCLAEMIWQAQYTKQQPDSQIYLACLRNKLGKE